MALPQTPSFRLDGKTALVTGASSGIGAACAVAMADAGAHVYATIWKTRHRHWLFRARDGARKRAYLDAGSRFVAV